MPWQPLAAYELKYTVLPGQAEGNDVLATAVRALRAVKIVEIPCPLISSVFQSCSPQFTAIKPRRLGIDAVSVDDIYLRGEAKGSLTGLGGLRVKISPQQMRIPMLPLDYTSDDMRPAETLSLIRITPLHLRLPDFPVLAAYLAIRSVWVSVQLGRTDAANTSQSPGSTQRSTGGLTALMLVMKVHGDIGAVGHIVSLAPEAITADIRRCRLAQAVGTTASCAILSSIFTHLAKHDYLPNQPALIHAAADVLAAHLSRRDFRELLRAGKSSMLAHKMRRLIDIQQLVKPDDPLRFARFAAIREGIVYGAITCYLRDQTRNRISAIALATIFAETALNFSSLSRYHLHGVSPARPLSLLSLVTSPVRMIAGSRWNTGAIEQAVTARFDACVAGMAKRGWIAGWPHELKGVDGLRIAQDYADEAKRIMRMVSSRPSPRGMGSWREASARQ